MASTGPYPFAHFAYVSVAAPALGNGDLILLVRQAWKNNTQRRIGGVLSFAAGEFRQIVEGHPTEISRLVAAILADPRHRDIEIKQYRLARARRFPTWSITGFPDVAAAMPAPVVAPGAEPANVIRSDLFRRATRDIRVLRGGLDQPEPSHPD